MSLADQMRTKIGIKDPSQVNMLSTFVVNINTQQTQHNTKPNTTQHPTYPTGAEGPVLTTPNTPNNNPTTTQQPNKNPTLYFKIYFLVILNALFSTIRLITKLKTTDDQQKKSSKY